ncbi:type VI secretion system protein TssA [Serratia quinivorans]|uniref:type VI secretion system protein TssA n=1 Tax=Serratia quinivorans TaxID=137545 RepID=UPI001C491C1B|nr:type VI secretion system protein TssA [Serratia quinivorans]MBV6692944.1 type VI secretion system protein TssA [Serratia quinivorans]
MAIDTLLAPVDAENPCGENLEYDTDFLAMEQAATGKSEQQFGSTIIPAEAPDWVQVERLATTLLMRTKDLRVMLCLTRAWTQLRGLQGYADGLMLIHQALERYWDTLLPLLEFDGEADPLFRINVLADLGDKAALTTSVRAAPLLKGATGEISLRDAGALLDGSKLECPTFPGGRARLQDELSQPERPEAQLVIRIAETLAAIRTTVTRHLGESALPEMHNLTKIFALVAQFGQDSAPASESAEQPNDAAVPPTSAAAAAPTATLNWRSAQIQSRDDAQLMLDKVKHYFRLHEPSHPAPLMIDRVQRLIALDFMQIIRDLAPDGLNQLETILGRPDNEENN